MCVSEPQDPKKPNQTQALDGSRSSQPMEQRTPTPGTTRLSPDAWKLRFRIGDQTVSVPVRERIIVGRRLEDEKTIDFDLSPYGAYTFGVSRQHAIITLHEGFLYLEDNNSTNGTRINGFQLTPKQKYRLRDGDEVEFARLRTSIRFEFAS
jgi:pSer/pThr/pTyr-binding forkhead associated (FHA) protein